MSESNKGKHFGFTHVVSDLVKARLSDAHKGEKNPNFGKSCPEYVKKAVSEGGKRYWENKKRLQKEN